jgi:hypothetical protein
MLRHPCSTYSSPLPVSLDSDTSAGDGYGCLFFHSVSDSSDSSACVGFSARPVCVLVSSVVVAGASWVAASSTGSSASNHSQSTIKLESALLPLTTTLCTASYTSLPRRELTRRGHDVFPWVGRANDDVVHRIWARLGVHMAQYSRKDAPVEVDEVVQAHLGKNSATGQDRNAHNTGARVTRTVQNMLEPPLT